jgi:hypothetical protein
LRLALIDMLIVFSPVAALLWVLTQTQGLVPLLGRPRPDHGIPASDST